MTIIIDSLTNLETERFPMQAMTRIMQSALLAADPYQAVLRNIQLSGDTLTISDITYILYNNSKIVCLSIGKAALAMADAANQQLAARIDRGVVVCKHNPRDEGTIGIMPILQGSHPVPDERSIHAAEQIQQALQGLTEQDVVVLLISGGGSALVCLPAPGITLKDMQVVTSALLRSGASINELNAVRKHLDLIKGGGLLKLASPAKVAALVISDVVNSPLDVIASGPAVPDSSTFKDVRAIFEKYLSSSDIPAAIRERVEKGCVGEVEETLKADDRQTVQAVHKVIASNKVSAEAAHAAAIREGFESEIITCELVGEARLAGERLAGLLNSKKSLQKPYLGIAGGETTVKVKGSGLGGRNLEVALGAVRGVSGDRNSLLITLATDGEDGPTDAAGALVTGATFEKAAKRGLNPDDFLKANDAYHFFERAGGLIKTGPTGTNVNDLNFILRLPDDQ